MTTSPGSRRRGSQLEAAERYVESPVHSLDAVVGLDDPGGICVFSHGARAMFGWTEDEVRGKPLELLVRTRRAGAKSSACHPGAIDDPDTCLHLVGHRRDGTMFPACVRLLSLPGAPRARTAVIRDLTRQDQLERELLQAQKLATVGLIAASVAHDLNNALTALNAQLYLAECELGPVQALAECKAILDRSARLARSLLELSSPPAEQPQAKVTELSSCVFDALKIVRRMIPGNLQVEAAVETLAAPVRVEASLVVNALINLILNARDALPGGGRVLVRLRAVDAQRINLSVEDNGRGMSAETLRHACEPFFTSKSPELGRGLGLAGVQSVVERASGTLTIRSQLGEGTVVSLEFPRAPPRDARSAR